MNKSIARKMTARLFFRQFFAFFWIDVIGLGLLLGLCVTLVGSVTYGGETINGLFYAGEAWRNGWRCADIGIARFYLPASNDVNALIGVFCGVIGVFEALTLISNTVKNYRLTRRMLNPLSDLAKAANELKTGVADKKTGVSQDKKPAPDAMASLAGQLGNIDAERLSSRINVVGEHTELRGLAAAINGMLDRIDAAYHAQVQFVSDASHELRTPISVIQGYANLLDRWGKNDEKALQESITAIKNETANMKDLVEQLLFLARGDSDTIALEPTLFDLAELASEIVSETSMIDPAHTFKLNTERVFVNADRALIKQAVRILVDNAIKYTDAGGVISVASSGGDYAQIAVSDSGIGIAPDVLPHVFERFTRADASRTRATGGAGLGLAIAKWIVTRHSGHLEALSREDIGTRMTIALPKSEAPSEPYYNDQVTVISEPYTIIAASPSEDVIVIENSVVL
ncbi:MAG: HAMP domain-containing histidine kinase [Oscillospiraceae bacterium]|jgi:signal transduction histidine kinase|nr:HAMP domain-containing histidine kinase [Oscillospiraceae bacterium]